MKKISFTIQRIGVLLLVLTLSSCLNDLDQTAPNDGNQFSSEEFFKNPGSYQQFLAKLYAGLATTGQKGPDGTPDIGGIDEGESQYVRGLWLMQELTTDEAIMGWNDKTIQDFHGQSWTSGDLFINAMFSRLDFQIKNCNEFLRQTTNEKLDTRGVTGQLREDIQVYRTEARFLRALSYWHFLDFFGNVAIVTEDSPTGFYLPEQSSRAELFNYVETELKAILAENSPMKPAKMNVYPRADKGAAHMLLAKLYMNAGVYINSPKYDLAFPEVQAVINGGYTLHSTYKDLFLADNDDYRNSEFIFAVAFDGLRTQTYGGTTFLTHAAVGGSMNPVEFGIVGGWAGIRTTAALVDKFAPNTTDTRGQFYTDGQTKEINSITSFTDGYAIQKWKNLTKAGVPGSDSSGTFVDIDFPMFRLADAYLMYAEIAVRGGGGSLATAADYVNLIRTRANTSTVSSGQLTLDFILDERARELHWEGHRRTDLVRFGKFSGGAYLWPWKGNTPSGSSTPNYRDLFPIPSNAIAGNPKLVQNTGY
ncbi:RagB/SusD family nutrient uptake outer membrane protein [Flavobacterium sp. '19STA2R22 D10 B1']|uniref:RagB/SusD family nutrient uptake outer membrane protein n=1 Tax=Flavobacterium aerium TaxID=3037261 RepID=UPI00278C2254|nr:RagB/SusD family nutrient uptake outer membrane protein [Flavobacterium sp. '19STA2R22 D10 B1']